MVKKIIIYMAVLLILSTTSSICAQYEDQMELISLDIKGMDIRDVLKILSQKSGLNIVADQDVKGKVVLYLKDVEVMDALDIIVLTNGLAYEQKGTLIRIMTNKKYEKLYGEQFKNTAKTEIVKLNYADASIVTKAIKQMKTRQGKIIPDDRSNTIVLIDNPDIIKRMREAIFELDVPLTTEVFDLNYADAEVIKGKLDQVVSKDMGSVRFDQRTNKIIVEDTSQKIEDIKTVIEAFDEKTREVVIDANIIQVTLSDKYSYGIDWSDIASLGDVRLTGDTNISTGLSSTTPSTLTLATTGGNYSTVVSLLKTYGETNVLSRPRITVADREEARILVGSKEAYVTSEVTTTEGGTYHTTDHVEFVDVGVSLTVTPVINKEGFVTMRIRPEVSSTDETKTVELTNPDGSTRTIVPHVTTSEAETTVVIKDGTTLIIGGLMKDTIVDHREKVPFLSDIPLLGKLFSTTGKSKEKTELVIFLTPYLIEGDSTTKEAELYFDEWEEKMSREEFRGESGARWEPFSDWIPKNNSPYEGYYLMVKEEINNMARHQDVSGLKGEVELQFRLDREGFLTRKPVVLNKPDLKLVHAAVNCVKNVLPFPPFPEAMEDKEAEFKVVVKYE